MGPVEYQLSMIGRDEVSVRRFCGVRRVDGRRDQDSITKSDAGMRSEREVKFFFSIAESFLAKGVGSEKAVSSGMPVGGKAGIGGGVGDSDGDGFLPDKTAEIGPASSGIPSWGGVLCFCGEVTAVDSG